MSPIPDRHGFNLLGPEVACMDCDARGPSGDWSEKKREKHRQQHVRELRKARERQQRQAARDARRLAEQARRENAVAYSEEA